MATGIIKQNTIIAIQSEAVEGTYEAPAAATSYIQPLEDGFDLSPAREQVERTILTTSIGAATPRLGIRSVAATLPVEFRGSGTEGGDVDYGPLLMGGLGGTRSGTASTSKAAGHTSTVIPIEDADISKYNVGDIVLVKEAGAYEARPISAVATGIGTASITFPFALDNGAPSASVVVGAFKTYKTAATGHPALSLSYYWGNTIRQAAIGTKVTTMSLEGFTPGQLASWNFGLEGLSYSEVDGAAPHTPSYDSGLPPIILKACVWRNGVEVEVNELTLTLTNTLGFLTNTCNANGRSNSRVTSREITGSFNPYKDDTATDYFDDWDAGTEFSLFAYAYNPHATTAGNFADGSTVAIWLPQCFTTEFQTQDVEGILTDQMSFRATGGSTGALDEMFLGLL